MYKITKLLLNGPDRTTFSSVNSSQIHALGENLIDAARVAKSTFTLEQYNIAFGKQLSYS